MSTPTKRDLERHIEDMEGKLEAARDLIDEALGLNTLDDDESESSEEDED
jgi:hypothetical protein